MNEECDIASDLSDLIIVGDESDCGYLPDRQWRMEYRLVHSLTGEKYEQLLARGWRRFGRTVFRPRCQSCRECVGLRIPVEHFRASKSQRRCRNRNSDVTVTIRTPTISHQHIDLYNRYHTDMSHRRGWPESIINPSAPDHYISAFLDGEFEFAREFQYCVNGQLVAVGLVDITETAMSSVYFFHDPKLRQRAPGTLSILAEINEAIRQNKTWLYLGYYIADCESMNYKNRFTPHELLTSFCADDKSPDWHAPDNDPLPSTR